MKSRITKWTFSCLLALIAPLIHSTELTYYLPNAGDYDKNIGTPESVLGYQVGDWHLRPEQIERYFISLAQQSPRVKVEVIGYTYEQRPLIHAYISSPENLERLETIRQQHLSGENSEQTPIVTWMGYSVHGNEASGSNASVLLAYHLAAAQDSATMAKLKDQVIIIDPMLNPDGLARFAHWVNMYKSQSPNADPKDIEHNESWPRGRTNHYWFDLNRDWLLLQHPESRARVSRFHQWRPNILTDFHEMGTNSSYFFQPGVHSRQNPLTPEDNFKMTATIAEYHAKALDDIGSLYYSKEDFDDFYYGKGSTYPDIHGTVGILFEQASARGHLQESKYGELSFPFAIRNHLTTSLSTIEAAQQNQKALKKLQSDFRRTATKEAKSDRSRAVVVSSNDSYRMGELTKILSGHQIQYYPLADDLRIKKQKFSPNNSVIIPLPQPQYRLIKALFETRTSFPDNIFYDVSAWNLALAMDLDYSFVSRSDYDSSLLGKSEPAKKAGANSLNSISPSALALAFDWNNFNSARLLSEMQQFGLRVQALTQPAELSTSEGRKALTLGSLILPLQNQEKSSQTIIDWLTPRLDALGIQAISVSSGLALKGVDMGSPSIPVIEKVKPLLLIGKGTSSYAAGEIWHLLDQRLAQPLTMMTKEQLVKLPNIQYTHIILAGGKPSFSEAEVKKLELWVKQGGVIIAHSSAAKWLTSQEWTSSAEKEFDKPVDTKVAYHKKGQVDAAHHIGGAIAMAEIDTSHPLAFGLDNSTLAIFKRSSLVFSEAKEAFVSIARFKQEPLASGYMSEANRKHIANGTSLLVQRLGKGRLVAFSDDPVFRGYWLGTAKVFINALYFAKAIEAPEKTKEKTSAEKKDKSKKQSDNKR